MVYVCVGLRTLEALPYTRELNTRCNLIVLLRGGDMTHMGSLQQVRTGVCWFINDYEMPNALIKVQYHYAMLTVKKLCKLLQQVQYGKK